MNLKKSIFISQNQTGNKPLKKQFTIQGNNNIDKRRSDDICINNFLNNYKNNQKDKISKIPIDHRMSYQDKNRIISSFMKQNINSDEKSALKDNNYYLNFVSNVYQTDSHLSNNNVIKKNSKETSHMLKNFIKKKSYNYSNFRNLKDKSPLKISIKTTNKKNSCCSNDIKKRVKKKVSINTNNDLKNQSNQTNKNTSNLQEKEMKMAQKSVKGSKFLSEKFVPKYQSSRRVSTIKEPENINYIKKFKSSRNLSNHKEKENNYNLKKEKNGNENNGMNDIKIIKINQNKNRRESCHNLEKQIEIEKSDTKNNDTDKNNVKNNQIIKTKAQTNNSKNNKHNYKSCLFCCFTVKDDSFPNE